MQRSRKLPLVSSQRKIYKYKHFYYSFNFDFRLTNDRNRDGVVGDIEEPLEFCNDT